MNKLKYGYMCKTDFDWELGEASNGTQVYASVEELKAKRKCVENCGIVKVKVSLDFVVLPGNKTWASQNEPEDK